MLLSGLLVGVLYGGGAANAQAAAPGGAVSAGSGAYAGASQRSGDGTATPGSAASTRRGRRASRGSGNTATGISQVAAPAETGNVQVTGFPSQNRSGSVDRPLLPIVSPGNALGIPSGTPIQVKLQTAIDSGHARNGDMIDAALAAPIGNLATGTPVRLTVVQAVPAGRLFSYGELSIQVVSINSRSVLSNTITAQGKEGAKELPDAAPARGTEAVFGADQTISLPAA